MESIKEYFTEQIKEKYLVEYIFHMKIQMEHYEKFSPTLIHIQTLVKIYRFERMLSAEEVEGNDEYEEGDYPIIKETIVLKENTDIIDLTKYDIFTPIDISYDFFDMNNIRSGFFEELITPNEDQRNYYEADEDTGLIEWKKIPRIVLSQWARFATLMGNVNNFDF